MRIARLGPDQAEAVVDCFRRVYGNSYANELFYDPQGNSSASAVLNLKQVRQNPFVSIYTQTILPIMTRM